jgi:hypothetical protein
MPPKNQTQRIDELLGGVTEELLMGNPQQFEDNSLRVERLLLEMVRPDPVQPRRVLPEQLHFAFHSNRLTPTQALKELVQLVQVAARQRGRPFNNVLELLPNPDDESDENSSVHLSPEEQLLHDLVNLAITIRDDGQVNPLTVVDVSQGVTQQFRIETGERRYWATWLLRDFIASYNGDGMIPCIIIPAERSSVFRQAKENTARSGLSAIAMARQAALLLLTVHGYQIPDSAVPNDFYRQALDLDLRGKREYTEAILSAMGGVNKSQFSRYKSLLQLSDEALELADRHNVEERKLRYILPLLPELHVEVVRQIIDFNLTSKQVEQICEAENLDKGDVSVSEDTISKQALRVARAFRGTSETTAYELANALIHQERSVPLAKARIQTLRRLLDDAERFLVEE